eukprot:snap_masked-scaffold_2-processed-gene-9.42-mRNA-1 protein AED:1.00 eAED:1.00 QI:0/-1/0/0/-1/1/1/0/375
MEYKKKSKIKSSFVSWDYIKNKFELTFTDELKKNYDMSILLECLNSSKDKTNLVLNFESKESHTKYIQDTKKDIKKLQEIKNILVKGEGNSQVLTSIFPILVANNSLSSLLLSTTFLIHLTEKVAKNLSSEIQKSSIKYIKVSFHEYISNPNCQRISLLFSRTGISTVFFQIRKLIISIELLRFSLKKNVTTNMISRLKILRLKLLNNKKSAVAQLLSLKKNCCLFPKLKILEFEHFKVSDTKDAAYIYGISEVLYNMSFLRLCKCNFVVDPRCFLYLLPYFSLVVFHFLKYEKKHTAIVITNGRLTTIPSNDKDFFESQPVFLATGRLPWSFCFKDSGSIILGKLVEDYYEFKLSGYKSHALKLYFDGLKEARA